MTRDAFRVFHPGFQSRRPRGAATSRWRRAVARALTLTGLRSRSRLPMQRVTTPLAASCGAPVSCSLAPPQCPIPEDVKAIEALHFKGRHQVPERPASDLYLQPGRIGAERLRLYRDLLSRSWSPQTAFPGTVNLNEWVPGTSRGQCGVSTMWLKQRLAQDFDFAFKFCHGALRLNAHPDHDIPDHCWLELKERPGGEIMVLDLTGDQSVACERAVIYDTRSNLERDGIQYVTRGRFDLFDLPWDIWERYAILTQNSA